MEKGAKQREDRRGQDRVSCEPRPGWDKTEGTVNKACGEDPKVVLFLPVSVCLYALCKGSGAVSNANGENAVSGKCSLINNIKSSSLSAGDIPHFSSLCASPRHLMMWCSLWDVRSMLISPLSQNGGNSFSPAQLSRTDRNHKINVYIFQMHR